MKRKILIFIFSSLLVFSLVGQISAGFSSLDVLNEFQNGIIDIEIGEEQSNVNKQLILPFDEICKNPYIKNNGSDCYVRAKLTFSDENIVADINGLSADWFLNNDGYFYYTKILKSNEKINIFESIKLGDIDQEQELTDFSIDINVDAIQSKNFIADFNSTTPWSDVEVLKTNEKNPNVTEYKPLPNTSFKIIYQDDIKGMIKNFDSFFNSVSTLMPGDCHEEILEIQNSTNKQQVIYFATQNISNEDFLSKVKFSIVNERGNSVFEGTLAENKKIIIDTLDAKTSSTIKFTIEIPKDLNNEFALDTSSVKWVFSTQQIEDVEVPQTGVSSNIEIYLLLMLASIIGLIFSIKGMKKHDKENS